MTYLWSRPIPRWTIVIGKVLALAPIAMVLVAGGWVVAMQTATGSAPTPESVAAFAAGAFAISAMSAGLATLVPRHGMALAIVYLVIFDIAIGLIPASLQNISISYQIRVMGDLDIAGAGEIAKPALTMAIISALWLTIGLWRIRRLES
jgi:ABC-type transport system involved in multi-copper enzyme maturation permease subunit